MLTKTQAVGLGWYGPAPSVLQGCGDLSPIKKRGFVIANLISWLSRPDRISSLCLLGFGIETIKDGLRPTVIDPGTRVSANLGHPYRTVALGTFVCWENSSVVVAGNEVVHGCGPILESEGKAGVEKFGGEDPSALED
jgi:hypothetical protein